MSKITVSSVFGTVLAKELQLVDIHDIPTSITIPVGTNETDKDSEVSPDTQVSDGQTDESN